MFSRDEHLTDHRSRCAGLPVWAWVWGFVGLGLVIRLVRYLMDQPIWGDEAFLAASFLDRGYAALARPLEYHQAAPLFFLWAERTAVLLFGFSEWSLRLFPTLCGLATVPLFALLAKELLDGAPRCLAVAVFAVAFYPVRHATEIKPYSCDLLVALGLLLLAVQVMRRPGSSGWLWGLAAATPIALGFSHPAVFVAGGIAVGLASTIWSAHHQRSTVLAYLFFGLALCCSFLVLYMWVTRGQQTGVGSETRQYWAGAFPPPEGPVSWFVWLVDVHTSNAFAYPIGGANGASLFTTLLVAIGILAWWRRGRREFLGLLLLPFALGLLASVLGRYPYGGSARTMQYVAPAICLLTGVGTDRIFERYFSVPRANRWLICSMGLLSVLGAYELWHDTVYPYKSVYDEQVRRFARWFWPAQEGEAVTVCLKRDLGTELEPYHWDRGRSAVYLCNQWIHSPRHRSAEPVPWDEVSTSKPLRCVLYNEEPQGPELGAWLERMNAAFEMRKAVAYTPVPRTVVANQPFEDRFLVFDFVPRSSTRLAASSRHAPCAVTKGVR